MAFDAGGLPLLSPTVDRYNVTINSVVYDASDPYLGHRGAHDDGPTRYFLPVPAGQRIGSITINSGGGTAVGAAYRENAIDVTTAGAPMDITVSYETSVTATYTGLQQVAFVTADTITHTQNVTYNQINLRMPLKPRSNGCNRSVRLKYMLRV